MLLFIDGCPSKQTNELLCVLHLTKPTSSSLAGPPYLSGIVEALETQISIETLLISSTHTNLQLLLLWKLAYLANEQKMLAPPFVLIAFAAWIL